MHLLIEITCVGESIVEWIIMILSGMFPILCVTQFESHSIAVPHSPPKFTKTVPDYNPSVHQDNDESSIISQRSAHFNSIQVKHGLCTCVI